MSYIDYPKILTDQELKSIGALMEQIKAASTRVSLKRIDGTPGEETVDLSMVLMSGLTYPERFAIIKRFFDHYKGHDDPIDMLWGLLTTGTFNDDLGRRSNLVNVFEPFCRHLYELVTGCPRPGIVLNDLFDLQAIDRSTFFMSKTSVLGRFFLKIKDARNIVGHGKTLPKDAAIMVVMGILILIRQYAKQLIVRFISDDEMTEADTARIASADEILAETEARMEALAMRQADDARSAIAAELGLLDPAVAGTDFALYLPRIASRLTYREGLTVIEGKRGSGVGTELLRAVARREPCPYMIRIDELSLTKVHYNLDWLVGIMNGTDRMTMLPAELEVSKQWILSAAAAGKLCLVISHPATSIAGKLRNLTTKLPGIMILVGLESLDTPGGKHFRADDPRVIRTKPLTEKQQKAVTIIVGQRLVRSADLSPLLLARMDVLGDRADLSHPRTLVAALRAVSAALADTETDYTSLTAMLRPLGGSSEAYGRLDDDMQSVSAIAGTVCDMIYGGAGLPAAVQLIRESDWMKNARARRRLFELCHLLEADDKVAMLATLAARLMLVGKQDSDDSNGPGYNPRLATLAGATRTLPVTEPRARNGRAMYRPEPRYIVERYVVNMLRTCPAAESADSLVAAALAVGTPEVTALLMRSPLFGASDQVYRFAPAAPPVNPVGLGVALVAEIQCRSMTDDGRCTPVYRTYMSLLEVMNDAQLLSLCDRLTHTLPPRSLTFLPTATAANLAIMSMDVPAWEAHYDTSARLSLLPEKFVSDFVARCDGDISRPLLMKVARHAAMQADMRLLRDCLAQLADTGAYHSPDFPALANDLLDHEDRDIAKLVVEMLDKIPLEDLDRDIATRIYNPTLTDLTISWLNNSATARTRLHEIDSPTLAMLSTVLPINYCVDGSHLYHYRLYGYQKKSVLLGVENFSDDQLKIMEGRFVDITGHGAAGRVTASRRILPTDADARYAHLTLAFPRTHKISELPRAISLSLGKTIFSKTIPCIATFQRDDSPVAIVRVTDAETIAALQKGPLNNVTAIIDGITAKVLDIETVRLSQPLTLIEVTACYTLSPAGIPARGRFSLHYTPDSNDRKYARTIALPLAPTVSRTDRGYIRGAISGGRHGDDLILVLPQPEYFVKGTVLRVNGDGTALKIVAQYFRANRQSIPDSISTQLNAALAALDGTGNDSLSAATALLVHPLETTVAELPPALITPGARIDARLKLQWVTGLYAPASPLWGDTAGTGIYECGWIPLHADAAPTGGFTARIPASPLWNHVAYMRLFGVPFTFKTTFNGTHWGFDAMIKSLLRSRAAGERASEPFYVMMLDADRRPLQPHWDDAVPLIGLLGDWGHIAPETASMIAEIAADNPAIIDKLRQSMAIEAALEGHDRWLRRKLFARSLTPAQCRLLPLHITRNDNGRAEIRWRDAHGNILSIPPGTVTQLKLLLKIK